MIGFYKLTEKQFEDFKNNEVFACPEIDPFNLFPKEDQKELKNEEMYFYNDVMLYAADARIIKDKKLSLYYVIIVGYKGIY